ncbi:MAG: glycosyltransferase N-terminal domain-containing protein, partial [Rikenellaceae bacterium]
MNFIYEISLHIYSTLIRVVSPFNPKARFWSRGRKGLLEKIAADLEGNTKKVAWFHAPSLGEFEQGRPVIELFR